MAMTDLIITVKAERISRLVIALAECTKAHQALGEAIQEVHKILEDGSMGVESASDTYERVKSELDAWIIRQTQPCGLLSRSHE